MSVRSCVVGCCVDEDVEEVEDLDEDDRPVRESQSVILNQAVQRGYGVCSLGVAVLLERTFHRAAQKFHRQVVTNVVENPRHVISRPDLPSFSQPIALGLPALSCARSEAHIHHSTGISLEILSVWLHSKTLRRLQRLLGKIFCALQAKA